MSDPHDIRRQKHTEAMAILVADGVLSYRPAIDALVAHDTIFSPTPEARAKWPRGYSTARSMAGLLDRDAISYPEAELTVCHVITGGHATEAGMESAGKMIGHALTRLDIMRQSASKELQKAITDYKGPATPETTAERRAKAVEAAQEVLRVSQPEPVMRRPARHP
jgi:hypothetical protein